MPTKSTPFVPPTAPEIEDALYWALTELIEHRRRRAESGPPPPNEVYSSAQLFAATQEVLRARTLVKDPIDTGLRQSIKRLGRLLHEQTDLHAAAERVADRDERNWGRRMSVLNSAFDGIGHWVA